MLPLVMSCDRDRCRTGAWRFALMMVLGSACADQAAIRDQQQYSIASQLETAGPATEFRSTPAPQTRSTVTIDSARRLHLRPHWQSLTRPTNQPATKPYFDTGILRVLAMSENRLAVFELRSDTLTVLDSLGTVLSRRPITALAGGPAQGTPDLSLTVAHDETVFVPIYLRGGYSILRIREDETPAAASTAFSAPPNWSGSFGSTSDERSLFVESTIASSDRSPLRVPLHTLYRVSLERSSMRVPLLHYHRADSLLLVADGSRTIAPLFASEPRMALAGDYFVLSRDTAPNLERFDLEGRGVDRIQLLTDRVAVAASERAELMSRSLARLSSARDSTLFRQAADSVYPVHWPVVAALWGTPSGQLLVIREDHGRHIDPSRRTVVFDLLDARLRFVGRGSLPLDERIVFFSGHRLCTSKRLPAPLVAPSSRRRMPAPGGESPARPSVLTCYLIDDSRG